MRVGSCTQRLRLPSCAPCVHLRALSTRPASVMDTALFGGSHGHLERQGSFGGISRKHPDYVAAVFANPLARSAVMFDFKPLIYRTDGGLTKLARIPVQGIKDIYGTRSVIVLGGERVEPTAASSMCPVFDAPLLAFDATQEFSSASEAIESLAAHCPPGHTASFVDSRELLMAPATPRDGIDSNTDYFALAPDRLPWSIPFHDAAVMGLARSLLVWSSKSKFCGRCGSTMTPVEGGVKKLCSGDKLSAGGTESERQALPAPAVAQQASKPSTRSGCGEQSYPRTDPVAITLVLNSSRTRALLGRGKAFPAGLYSCLAGYLEPGETVEEAAVREVQEEAGVAVRPSDVRYVGSQPWPVGRGATVFGQLMLGAVAVARNDNGRSLAAGDQDPAITVDPEELADARWFDRSEVEAALRLHYRGYTHSAGTDGTGTGSGNDHDKPGGLLAAASAPSLKVPGPFAIAHNLMRAWVRDELPELPKL